MITPAHAFFNWAILRKWLRPWWVVAGSVLPDTPPFVAFFYLLAEKGLNPPGTGGFFGFVMANGNPNNLPGFMEARFLLNALPLYALVGVVFFFFWRGEWLASLWAAWRPCSGASPSSVLGRAFGPRPPDARAPLPLPWPSLHEPMSASRGTLHGVVSPRVPWGGDPAVPDGGISPSA